MEVSAVHDIGANLTRSFLSLLPPPMHATTKANPYYRRAILKAIEELHDFQSRSNIDAIRRHCQASMESDFQWNDAIFLKTLKATAQDGDVEQHATLAGLSTEFKRKRANSLTAVKEHAASQPMQSEEEFFEAPPSPPHYHHRDHDLPKRKTEHAKSKITPRKLQSTIILVNPMDTR